MPRQKNFKKLVRTRAAKTGESYTAARAHFEPNPSAGHRPVGDPDASALARVLASTGIVDPADGKPFSEALLFGVGCGIGFSYLVFEYQDWTSIHLDGRRNTLYFEKLGFVQSACSRLGPAVRVQQLSTPEQAKLRLRKALDANKDVLLTLDLDRLPGDAKPVEGPYFPYPVTVSVDGDDLSVTGLPGGAVTMGWPELLEARWTHAKKYGGLYLIDRPGSAPDVVEAIRAAVVRTAECLLEPSRSSYDANFGVPGMRKWARLLTDPRDQKGWPTLCAEDESRRAALTSVVSGLGGLASTGAASRPLYADFLDEAATRLARPRLADLATEYRALGEQWAALVATAGRPDTTGADLAENLPDLIAGEQAAATSLREAVAEAGVR